MYKGAHRRAPRRLRADLGRDRRARCSRSPRASCAGTGVHGARPSRARSDSLPWLFYKDGVRELRLLRGFEHEELDKLLDILQRVRKASPDEDDLLTMLWEGDFVAPALPLRRPGAGVGADRSPTASRSHGTASAEDDRRRLEEEQPSRAPGVVNMADFDGTLYFLDEREIEYLQTRSSASTELDLRQNVVAMLLDIFEQQADTAGARRGGGACSTCSCCTCCPLGSSSNVAYLLRESQAAVQRAPNVAAANSESGSALIPSRLSAPEALSAAAPVARRSRDAPAAAGRCSSCSSSSRPAALATVLEWLGRMQNIELRPMLEQAAERLARAEHRGAGASSSGRPMPRRGARSDPARRRAEVAGRRRAARARCSRTATSSMRVGAVQALGEIGSPGALQALERGIEDSERDVRVAAVRALSARSYRAVLPQARGDREGQGRSATPTSPRRWRCSRRTARCAATTAWRRSTGCSTASRCSADERTPSSAPAPRWRSGASGTPKAQEALRRAADREGRRRAERGEPRARGGTT